MSEKTIKIIYDNWLENHADTDDIKAMWKRIADFLPSEPPEILNKYIEALEQQAFHAGFAAGVVLMTECVYQRAPFTYSD